MHSYSILLKRLKAKSNCLQKRTGGEVGLDGLDQEGGEAGGCRRQGGGDGSVGDGKGVGAALKHQLGAGVESIPAKPQDHHAKHKQGGVVASEVIRLHQYSSTESSNTSLAISYR